MGYKESFSQESSMAYVTLKRPCIDLVLILVAFQIRFTLEFLVADFTLIVPVFGGLVTSNVLPDLSLSSEMQNMFVNAISREQCTNYLHELSLAIIALKTDILVLQRVDPSRRICPVNSNTMDHMYWIFFVINDSVIPRHFWTLWYLR